MASNFFGELFRITTFGESHGSAIGVVIDGCPAGLSITKEEIDEALALRQPGRNKFVSPRSEKDGVEILSGLYEGKTTGAPIALLIRNQNADSSPYTAIQNLYRPGHANFTYLEKYGLFDPRGGGRASARETVARVAAGAVAKKLIGHFGIHCVAFVAEIGGIGIDADLTDLATLREKTYSSPIFCPDERQAEEMMRKIEVVKAEGDSLGGILACVAHLPAGLGDPVYQKLEAKLAAAMLSLPATKGFEIGEGFAAARLRGSEHNDSFIANQGKTSLATNRAGGTLGGISTGAPLYFRVAFKPTSSIQKPQSTVTLQGEPATLQHPPSARHDPCVAIRAVPIVEAMVALVLADVLLFNRCATLHQVSGCELPGPKGPGFQRPDKKELTFI
ncbi:MAG: chorismate synthase [Verrucomicrobiota bacterium]|nr:chorismate synthase [Verrucomicrobiota bacterium]